MKITVRVRLRPDAAQEAALRETLKLCNRAANLVSKRAFETEVTAAVPLQRLVYGEVKAMGLSAQPAIHCVRKTAGAYAARTPPSRSTTDACLGNSTPELYPSGPFTAE